MVDDHEARVAASPAEGADRAGVGGSGAVVGSPDRGGRTDQAKDRLLREDKTTWVNGEDMTKGVLGRSPDGQ